MITVVRLGVSDSVQWLLYSNMQPVHSDSHLSFFLCSLCYKALRRGGGFRGTGVKMHILKKVKEKKTQRASEQTNPTLSCAIPWAHANHHKIIQVRSSKHNHHVLFLLKKNVLAVVWSRCIDFSVLYVYYIFNNIASKEKYFGFIPNVVKSNKTF